MVTTVDVLLTGVTWREQAELRMLGWKVVSGLGVLKGVVELA